MRVALVTGAAGGIGAAIARAFAAEGAAVVATDRPEPPLPPGAGAMALALDPTDEAAVAAAFAMVAARFGRLDAMAVIATLPGGAPLGALSWADWERAMDHSVGAMFLAAKHGLPLLARGTAPAIVVAAPDPGAGAPADDPARSAAAAAVESFASALAGEAADWGVRVSAVVPGRVDAGPARAAAARSHPPGSPVCPEEVAAAVAWLASPRASFVTGATLVVNGAPMRAR